MPGYWRDGYQNKEAIDPPDGWHTGDLVPPWMKMAISTSFTAQGYDHPGRRKYLSPEIEEFLFTHPKVSEVQTIGVLDENTERRGWPGSSSKRGKWLPKGDQSVLPGQNSPL